ncbi:MAG TPA: D-glycero-beta-D-manno-heptose 1,7-bisphosphate 7-phosphatase [Candidatus Omnitrophota bacterium]|nr:D-glycero-beta-D-manno-heptose 1,7-bisphosphate 7-phosphatase [Candidatus Omnitrophota bacterium]
MAKIVFLDRDGVINKYPGDRNYVTSLKNFKILKGSLEAIARLYKAGYEIFVISNQAGVAKRLYTKKTLDEMTDHLLKEVCAHGGKIKKVYYCLHTEDMKCECRKPKDGMLKKAVKGKKIDLKSIYFIGDSMRDVKAGKAFGCKTVLVLTGRESLKNIKNWDAQPDFVAKNLFFAATNILKDKYDRA